MTDKLIEISDKLLTFFVENGGERHNHEIEKYLKEHNILTSSV